MVRDLWNGHYNRKGSIMDYRYIERVLYTYYFFPFNDQYTDSIEVNLREFDVIHSFSEILYFRITFNYRFEKK